MDKNSLIIILGIVVVFNFIILIVLGKSNKKIPKAPKRKENNVSSEIYDEPEGKTEMLGRPRQQNYVSESNSNIRHNFSKIPDLSDSVKERIIGETIIELSTPAGATELIGAEPQEKVYGVLSFMENGTERAYEMKKSEIFIGRDPAQCDLIIPSDTRIGRKHARLFVKDGQYFIEDLQSKNGTYVDGIKITDVSEVASKKFKLALTEITIK